MSMGNERVFFVLSRTMHDRDRIVACRAVLNPTERMDMLWMGKQLPPTPKPAKEKGKETSKLTHGSPSSPSVLAATPTGAPAEHILSRGLCSCHTGQPCLCSTLPCCAGMLGCCAGRVALLCPDLTRLLCKQKGRSAPDTARLLCRQGAVLSGGRLQTGIRTGGAGNRAPGPEVPRRAKECTQEAIPLTFCSEPACHAPHLQ